MFKKQQKILNMLRWDMRDIKKDQNWTSRRENSNVWDEKNSLYGLTADLDIVEEKNQWTWRYSYRSNSKGNPNGKTKELKRKGENKNRLYQFAKGLVQVDSYTCQWSSWKRRERERINIWRRMAKKLTNLMKTIIHKTSMNLKQKKHGNYTKVHKSIYINQ